MMPEWIAKITWNPETLEITDIALSREDLRFKCRRCAVFCCKLGGPKVSGKDLKRLSEAGREYTNLLVQMIVDNTKESINQPVLPQKEDGSCIFLQHDLEGKVHRCNIYDLRPSLCRLYPFEFQRTSPNTGILRLIPCCNGLNASDGLLVDKKFIEKYLLGPIVDLL